MPKKIAPAFQFIGNHPALDFINTKIALGGQPVELLCSWEDVLEWLSLMNFYTKEQLDAVIQKWEYGKGESLVEEAIALRKSMLTMVQNRTRNIEVSEEDMSCINKILQEQVITTKLIRTDHRFAAEKQVALRKPSDLLIPVAEVAVDLFCHYDIRLIKKCENPACVLYFYDNSRNSTRRWCSQKTCGNRMKVTAYLERHKNKDTKES
ncbi:CGNR zinc finger domain-containing protein [Paenibacillus cellulositrophicus]|uniref:CGNR zinc finger domain-containing protein n=1 Tax=Paenibacillus cellulositrophicus TaxID=562959 RepID=UPI003F807968